MNSKMPSDTFATLSDPYGRPLGGRGDTIGYRGYEHCRELTFYSVFCTSEVICVKQGVHVPDQEPSRNRLRQPNGVA